jgi:hypothetical protein
VTIHFDGPGQWAKAVDESGREVPATFAFWFAWQAFHPQTEVYEASGR